MFLTAPALVNIPTVIITLMLRCTDSRQGIVDIRNKETCLKKRPHPRLQNIYFQDSLAHAEAMSFISGIKFTTI